MSTRRVADHLDRAMTRQRGERADAERRTGVDRILVAGFTVAPAAAADALRRAGWTVSPPGSIAAVTAPRARIGDRATSRQGARDVTRRAGSQSHQLLKAYAVHDDRPTLDGRVGLTDEEAHEYAVALGFLRPSATRCYWKRCGELRDERLIEVVTNGGGDDLTRVGAAGSPRLVCRITTAGRAELKRLAP